MFQKLLESEMCEVQHLPCAFTAYIAQIPFCHLLCFKGWQKDSFEVAAQEKRSFVMQFIDKKSFVMPSARENPATRSMENVNPVKNSYAMLWGE